MKILILVTKGKQRTIDCDNHVNIRELRNEISLLLNKPWDGFEIHLTNVKEDMTLIPIYTDDDPEVELHEFIKMHGGEFNVADRLSVLVMPQPKLSFYRPTHHNPEGLSVEEALVKRPRSQFFKDICKRSKEGKLKKRLQAISFPIQQVPAEFRDSFTDELMENPIITIVQKCLDASTIEYMLKYDESMKMLYQESRPNLQLKSKLEDFVVRMEKLYKSGHLITLPKSEKFLSECDDNIVRIQNASHQFDSDKYKGMDTDDAPEDVPEYLDDMLMTEAAPISMTLSGRLDRIEVSKLLVLATIYTCVTTDIKRRGYSNLLDVFNEAISNYINDISTLDGPDVDEVMKLHRSRWFRESIFGKIVGKMFPPSSAKYLRKLGFFDYCAENMAIQPRFVRVDDVQCILDGRRPQ